MILGYQIVQGTFFVLLRAWKSTTFIDWSNFIRLSGFVRTILSYNNNVVSVIITDEIKQWYLRSGDWAFLNVELQWIIHLSDLDYTDFW